MVVKTQNLYGNIIAYSIQNESALQGLKTLWRNWKNSSGNAIQLVKFCGSKSAKEGNDSVALITTIVRRRRCLNFNYFWFIYLYADMLICLLVYLFVFICLFTYLFQRTS